MTDLEKAEELANALSYVSPICNKLHESEWRHEQSYNLRSLISEVKELRQAKEALDWLMDREKEAMFGILSQWIPRDLPPYLKSLLEKERKT